jgi:hypothetical protein
VKFPSNSKEKALWDKGTLRSGAFVEEWRRETDEKVKQRPTGEARRHKAVRLVQEVCKTEGIRIEELRGGSRPGQIP